MTMLRPSLSLRRMVILKSGRVLYDQSFNSGLNIIRGENSSGKSTVANLIFYSLGGDVSDWTPEAGAADSVHSEVAINGVAYTLSRDVERKSRCPLYIFQGTFDDAMNSRESWLRYPYMRTGNTESFSQVLFNLLGFPEQKTETHQNITMHQLLRLLYVDQITPVDEVLRREQRFDKRDTRTAVGELLLGIDDLEMHDLRLRLREAERHFSEVAGELRSMFRVFGQTDHATITVINYEEQIADAELEQAQIRKKMKELAVLRDKEAAADADKKITLMYETLRQVKTKMDERRRQEQATVFDLEDSTRFISTLNERLKAIVASEHMVSILGNVQFNTCPACFQITTPTNDDSVCHLCKAPISRIEPWVGHLKMREELTFQIRESERLIEQRDVELTKLRTELANLIKDKRTLEEQLSTYGRSVHVVDAEIEVHMHRIGYLDRLIEDLNERATLATLIQQRIDQRNRLNLEISSLKDDLNAAQASRERRIKEVKARISILCVDALRNDLPLEESFQSAESVEFDFGLNKIWADDRTHFSASSMTLLKNALITAMFRLSLEDEQVRWPRFLLLDNIEDKGMQPERSANFQEFLADRLVAIDSQKQVIMTTSMISPKLNDTLYCVGPYYTHEKKTLNYKSRESSVQLD